MNAYNLGNQYLATFTMSEQMRQKSLNLRFKIVFEVSNTSYFITTNHFNYGQWVHLLGKVDYLLCNCAYIDECKLAEREKRGKQKGKKGEIEKKMQLIPPNKTDQRPLLLTRLRTILNYQMLFYYVYLQVARLLSDHLLHCTLLVLNDFCSEFLTWSFVN